MTISVKLPKEVLSLFPTWEYRCPCCSTYVESNVSLCPNCKTPFNEKMWRVPPRFLKSHDAMSEYAHKVLAPKLTQKQRELLFQYFTELFNDGFESGDFSAWTGTTGSPSVVSDPVYDGTHAMEGAGGGNYCIKSGFTEDLIYTRVYVRTPASITSGQFFNFMYQYSYNPLYGSLTRLGIINDGGTWKWRFRYYHNGSLQTDTSTQQTPSASTWYCVEAYYKRGASDAEYKMYVDDNELTDVTHTGCICDYAFHAIYVGNLYSTASVTIHIDCVVVADTYIGPETTEQTYTKTWTTDALFKKLGIPKTLGVDATFQKQDIPKTFGLDATFQKSFLIQKQIDAFFKRFGILKNFAVDARFGSLMTHTISKQIDVLLKRLDATKTFGLDVYFGPVEAETYAKNFGLDIIFAYKVRLPELWLDENGKIVLNISKPYTWVGT